MNKSFLKLSQACLAWRLDLSHVALLDPHASLKIRLLTEGLKGLINHSDLYIVAGNLEHLEAVEGKYCVLVYWVNQFFPYKRVKLVLRKEDRYFIEYEIPIKETLQSPLCKTQIELLKLWSQ
ncbi:hypothetical protein K9N68_37650 (plasmid) [Kovacikia minuta CCNUW1]|uniref:hypothetical protein n=1 Tax=Kovacikia minuta TaxID=2931930 RepID=UPI001CCA062D|nr:hypothetical protein [Kovacikia minuta]UBF29939.1 hypothetical protein K9N68_37650 [Kovacikia minuta CCNUW1]